MYMLEVRNEDHKIIYATIFNSINQANMVFNDWDQNGCICTLYDVKNHRLCRAN